MASTEVQREWARNWYHKKKAEDPSFRGRLNAQSRSRYANSDEGERRRLKGLRQRSSRETWPTAILSLLRSRAEKKDLNFNLEASDIVVPDTCPILGVKLVFGGGKNHPHGPSVDRVIPELGYVKGNVRVISYMANALKRNCTDPEVFRRLADYIESNTRGAKWLKQPN
jgi:hypothetical protein